MGVYVALLRGVNVGGNNKLPMKSLCALCEVQGCKAVQTYIQSGNIVFQASAKVAAAFPARLKAQIQEEFGFETTVILRTAAELRAAAENNPFPADYSHVMFLDAEPNVTDAVKLDPPCTGKEAFSLRGKDLFLYLPDGAGRSKMAAYRYDKVLRTAVSMRNWRTVQQLLALVETTLQRSSL